MRALRQAALAIALITSGVVGVAPASARSVGQVLDDTVLTTEVKAKLTAEKVSNLTKIEVKTDRGIVTLNGVVDTPERRARAAQIASSVDGVKGIVNNIHVAGSTVPAAPVSTTPAPVGTVDATGIVAQVDSATGTITLQDGRVLRVTGQTAVWQPATTHGLRPGTQVLLREATPVAVQPTAPAASPDWRMGTIRSVDHATGLLVLTDGTMVRLAPNAVVRRGNDRLALDQIVPGSEVVIRASPPLPAAGGEGSALPGRAVTIDASEVSVVWAPVGNRR